MANRYYVDISHPGLKTYQRIAGTDPDVVQRRARAKTAEWEQRWGRLQEAERIRASREAGREQRAKAREEKAAYLESQKAESRRRTQAAEDLITELENTLKNTISFDDRINFQALKNTEPFPESPPIRVPLRVRPPEPSLERQPRELIPPSGLRKLLELVAPGKRLERLEREAQTEGALQREDERRHADALKAWQASRDAIANLEAKDREAFQKALADHDRRKGEYLAEQSVANARVDDFQLRYLAGHPDAVQEYCELVLSNSRYPDCIPKKSEVFWVSENKLLIVEFDLPRPEDMPRTKAVRYVQSDDDFVETYTADSTSRQLYDAVVYQLAIRTIHEMFESDVAKAVDIAVFNGMVDTVDRASGKQIRPCILSIQASREEFLSFNLAEVDAKACFRKLKGIGSSQMHALVPVAPLVRLPTRDVRYIDGREILDSVDDGTNLAMMDWGDFEHLIRQLFEREFAAGGAEVRVTRASRDGGVDAVILDPDPIRGGKFVVQAKRYTNLVGVSSVRDLYGTMINEGAVKGILVTTATFGPDSYEFAKDKPITLIDGSNLLFLLQKHGTKAFIDIKAAKAAGIVDQK